MPPRLAIQGSGPLSGSVSLSGAKNAALPELVACLLVDEPCVLENVPTGLKDIRILLHLLESVGASVRIEGATVTVAAGRVQPEGLDAASGAEIRSTLVFLGALLARCGRARVPLPGGCRIGERRYDLHLKGLRNLGAVIEEVLEGDRAFLAATAGELVGAEIGLYLPTTTGTQNIVFGALAARGRTRLTNANTRPENEDFLRFLEKMGAGIEIHPRVVSVDGGRPLHGAHHRVVNGWDEMLTWIIACAMCGGEIRIAGGRLDAEPEAVRVLREIGVELFAFGGAVLVKAQRERLKPFTVFTAPYPGINSDMQPLFAALAATIPGESTVIDTRFTERFQYAEEMRKLGADIAVYGNSAVVRGAAPLRGAAVSAPDLRGGAALALLGLAAEGTTIIANAEQIDRGYEGIERKAAGLGASIARA